MTYALKELHGHRHVTVKLGPKAELVAWLTANYRQLYKTRDGECLDFMAVRGNQADVYSIEPVAE